MNQREVLEHSIGFAGTVLAAAFLTGVTVNNPLCTIGKGHSMIHCHGFRVMSSRAWARSALLAARDK